MINIERVNRDQVEAEIVVKVLCHACHDRELNISMETWEQCFIASELNDRGWRQITTENEHIVQTCPQCVAQLEKAFKE
jgi:hypothetical protein